MLDFKFIESEDEAVKMFRRCRIVQDFGVVLKIPVQDKTMPIVLSSGGSGVTSLEMCYELIQSKLGLAPIKDATKILWAPYSRSLSGELTVQAFDCGNLPIFGHEYAQMFSYSNTRGATVEYLFDTNGSTFYESNGNYSVEKEERIPTGLLFAMQFRNNMTTRIFVPYSESPSPLQFKHQTLILKDSEFTFQPFSIVRGYLERQTEKSIVVRKLEGVLHVSSDTQVMRSSSVKHMITTELSRPVVTDIRNIIQECRDMDEKRTTFFKEAMGRAMKV